MKLRKSGLSMAVASTLAVGVLYPALSSAISIDVSGAGNVLSSSGGDTLIYPIYTTGPDGDTTTSFSLTNTSDEEVVIAKIRFREQLNSMDALDWIVVLSPNDKFDFTVLKPANSDRPVMRWDDSSCIVGPGQGATQVTFPITDQDGNNNNSYVYDETALLAGHLEILGMAGLMPGEACLNDQGNDITAGPCVDPAIDLALAATHVNGDAPPNCSALRTVLTSQSLTNALAQNNNSGTSSALDAPNSLVGRYVVTVPSRGIEAGGDAMAIKNSDLPLSSQSTSSCSNANSNCASRYGWDGLEFDHPHLADMGAGVNGLATVGNQLTNFQVGLAAANVAGDWSNNPATDVGVEWVMSFPSKYTYTNVGVDGNGDPAFSTLTQARSPSYVAGAFDDDFGGNIGQANLYPTDGCLETEVFAYGIEEETGVAGEVISPSPTGDNPDFCNETNFLTYSINGQVPTDSYLAPLDANGDSRRQTVSFDINSVNTVVRGWAYLGVNWTGSAAATDAVRGIIFTTRDTDQAGNNNASITELQQNIDD